MSMMSGIALKSCHSWCARPKVKKHKSSELCKLRKKEFEAFLLQDSISYAHPSKKFAGKRFLRDTLEITRKKYLQQTEYHTNGVISLSTMKHYHPSYIMLCSQTLLDQCLCDHCENSEQILKALHSVGISNIPPNRYAAIKSVVCNQHGVQFGSEFTFPQRNCIFGSCSDCGEAMLQHKIHSSNEQAWMENRSISWWKWVSLPGKSAPAKCQIKGTLQQAIHEMLQMLNMLKPHLFRANWNRNIFEYLRKNLQVGQVVQIFDFAMNFRNMYQDEVQSAYWDGTQTSIHAVINYFPCQNVGCRETTTLVLAQITDDL